MRYFLFGLATLVFIFSISRFYRKGVDKADSSKDRMSTTIRLSKTLVDVGERKPHSVVDANFTIYNTGTNSLYIQNVVPDCHCTVASFSTKPIPPLDSTIISLRYDATRPGVFQSSAVITTNSSPATTLLIMRGSIE